MLWKLGAATWRPEEKAMASARWTLICRKRPLGSETNKWKGPEAGACLACLRNSDEMSE